MTHCLLHVSKNVEQLQSNLDGIAAWPFERLARIFKPFLRTGHMPVNQINNRLMERFVHQVPTFMDVVHPYGNRMRYVMGDITATTNVIHPRKQQQQRITSKSLEKTAEHYSHNMKIHSMGEAERSSAVDMPAGNTPLRMFLGAAPVAARRTESSTITNREINLKRLTYDAFELGNTYPNNCALIVDIRSWREKREIKYNVVIIHDIFASKTNDQDQLDLNALKQVQEHVLATSTASSSSKEKIDQVSCGAPQQQAEDTTTPLDSSNIDIGDMIPATTTRTSTQNRQKVIFRISGSKFRMQEPFNSFPVDSSKNHIYEVQKPRSTRTIFLANQVSAKMIALPMLPGKPHDFSAHKIINALFEQKW